MSALNTPEVVARAAKLMSGKWAGLRYEVVDGSLRIFYYPLRFTSSEPEDDFKKQEVVEFLGIDQLSFPTTDIYVYGFLTELSVGDGPPFECKVTMEDCDRSLQNVSFRFREALWVAQLGHE